MNMKRATIIGLFAALVASTAFAQGPGSGSSGTVSALGGRAFGVGPQLGVGPTPLGFIGGVAVGIWTRVPPPYDVTANRSGAANPLP